MRPGFAWAAGVGLLLLAFGVTLFTPSDDVLLAPFARPAELGTEAVSEHHVVTLHEVALADVVDLDRWHGTTAGVWLVADATIAGHVERVTVRVDLFVDGVRYESTPRADRFTVDGGVADAGLPRRGAILVELPRDILDRPGARSAVLRIGGDGDTRLDAVLEWRLDFTALERHSSVELDRPRDVIP